MSKVSPNERGISIFSSRRKAAALLMACTSAAIACGGGGRAGVWHNSAKVLQHHNLSLPDLGLDVTVRFAIFNDHTAELDTFYGQNNLGYASISCQEHKLVISTYAKQSLTDTAFSSTGQDILDDSTADSVCLNSRIDNTGEVELAITDPNVKSFSAEPTTA